MSDNREYIQEIHTESGFSYGTIGADIHVFGNGVPLYLLLNWRGEPQMDSGWLRRMPSRMLNARFAVVPFTGRADALAELVRWRDDNAFGSSVRWLYSEGGSGKTRLAVKLADESVATGWKVVAAIRGPGTVLPPPGSQDMRTDGARGLLLLVDYADHWPREHLDWLLSNGLLNRPGLPTRVLLLARTRDKLPELRAALAGQQIEVSEQQLRTLRASAVPRDPAEGVSPRQEMYHAARAAFAERYGMADADGIASPVPLDHPDMGLILAVHMAALVGVDARYNGQRPPGDVAGLSLYLLDREHLRWRRMPGDGTDEADPERGYRTPAEVMHRVVFTAALTGRLSRELGTELLALTGAVPADAARDTAEQVLADHSRCYPAEGSAGSDTVFEPLYPDRLAEDFIALTLPGHQAAYPAQRWAEDVLRTVLRRSSDDQSAAWWTSRTLGFLIAAASRWEHVGPRHLYPLLRRDPDLAIDGGSAVLSGLAVMPDAQPSLLRAIRKKFNPASQPGLQTGAADVMERLAQHDLRRAWLPAARAKVFDVLATYLFEAGRSDREVAALEQSVAITRRRATPNSLTRLERRALSSDAGDVQIKLAASLGILANGLNAIQQHERAIAAAKESISILDELDQAPDDFEGVSLAYISERTYALGTLSQAYSFLGREEEALSVTRAIVELRREQGRQWPFAIEPWMEKLPGNDPESLAFSRRIADPDGPERGLANALVQLAIRQSNVGDYEDAAASLNEALDLLLALLRNDPDQMRPIVADALERYASALAKLGKFTDAAASAEVAVEAYRILAGHNSSRYGLPLGYALGDLGQHLYALGRLDEAIAAAEEGFAIRERHTAAALDDARTAEALASLSTLYIAADNHARALATAEDAVARVRALDGRLPLLDLNAYLFVTLVRLASAAYAAGDHERALAANTESVAIKRQSQPDAAAGPGRSERVSRFDLAIALGNRCSSLTRLGRLNEAAESAAQALEIFRSLAASQPTTYERDVARTLANTADLLGDLGRHDEAIATARESAEIYRRLATAQPTAHEPDLARALNILDTALHKAGRDEESVAALAEASEIHRRLAAARPGVHEIALARVLKYKGRRYRTLGRYPESLEPTREAVRMCRVLADARPVAYTADLADTLSDLGILFADMDQPQDALAATAESAELYRGLYPADPGQLSSLADELKRLVARQCALGMADEAAAVRAEALDRYRELVARTPPTQASNRADALEQLSIIAIELGDHTGESLAAMEEAAAILSRLAEVDPALREPNLARVLGNLAHPLAKLGRIAEAHAVTVESIAIYDRLAERNSAGINEEATWVRENLQALEKALTGSGQA
jgi:hypothetical protein